MIMALPKTMKAVVVHGIEDYRLEELPLGRYDWEGLAS